MKAVQTHIRLCVILILIVVPYVMADSPYHFQELTDDSPSPPPQPTVGPGGNEYVHGAVTTNGPYWAAGHSGNDNYLYYIYEPAQPTPVEAPAVFFLHGWKGTEPRSYGAWIEHIVKKGYVVVWGQYQAGSVTLPWLFPGYAISAWRDALERLNTEPSHVRVEKDYKDSYKTAIVGHSAGGYLSVILAAMAGKTENGIPRPYAVVAIEPGGLGIIPHSDFSQIDKDTYVIIVVGNNDDVVCKSTAVFVWNEIASIYENDKDFLLVRSDSHGSPTMIADHYFPTTLGFFQDAQGLDAFDFFVTFKLSVGALNCSFKRSDCEYALGHGSSEQVDMGKWSDGRPLAPMVWVEDPNLLETTCEDPAPMGCCSRPVSSP